MTLEELIEARLCGEDGPPTTEVPTSYRPALIAHDALIYALGETIGWTRDEDRSPPTLPSDYEIVRELGRGGMGVVYLARQKSLGREVAVKVLRGGVAARSELARRFLDEARYVARVRHPNVVAVHEVGQADDEPYFAMDYVPGESLAALLARGPLTPARAVTILKQIADAIHHAHEQGIIHRDLKPGNVLIDREGRALVTDFGLARDLAGASDLTRPGQLLGTPAYVAPEQARGEHDLIGETTDVYALGAILYEMLTGKPPFGNDAPAAVFARLLHEDPVPPHRLVRHVPRDLETICLKALAKSPSERYASARAFLEDLRRYELGEPILARRPGVLRRTARFVRRQWRLLATAGLTAILVAGLFSYLADRSVADLRTWGKEREQLGDLAGAIDVYHRAWQKSTGAERAEVLTDLVRCIRSSSDAQVAVEAALKVLREEPGTSFGPHDYLVAQRIVADLKSRQSGRSLSEAGDADRETLLLAQRRLEAFLDSGSGSDEERKTAADQRDAVVFALNGRPTREQTEALPKLSDFNLPEGTTDELQRLANDATRYPWDRGKAAFVLAKRDSSKTESRRAFDLLRSAYPTYSGIAAATVIAPTTVNRIGREAVECRLLREAHELSRKLDPTLPNALRGGLLFRIKGVELPENLAVDLRLTLLGDGVKESRTFLPHRTVPFVGNRAEVGVADGRYSMKIQGHHLSYPSALTRFARLLQLDVDRTPNQVKIDGSFDEIIIPARMIDEITLLGPAAGSTYDPSSDFLRWSEIKGAAYYRVQLAMQEDRANVRSVTSLADVKVKTNRVCLGALDDANAQRRMEKLRAGRIVTWTIEAFDKQDRRIAASVETERPVLLTGGKPGR